METEETLSRQLYHYLCEVVGSEETVSARRLFFKVFDDCYNTILMDDDEKKIHSVLVSSGSKGEGLDFSGSDLDLMYVLVDLQVYSSHGNTQSNSHLLCYDMEYSQPGFCRIKICPSQINEEHSLTDVFNRFGEYCPLIIAAVIYTDTGIIIACDKFKHFFLSFNELSQVFQRVKLHGPCITSYDDALDLAYCLPCPVWPSQASRWIARNRSTDWPSVDLVSKIVREGILFVPIGGTNVDSSCEWRISFSVGEKILIHSLNHTQLLCYALLKFVLKEIINVIPDLQNLLCSYFMKTVLFWVLEELDVSVWTQENLLSCFRQCFKRLVYFVDCGYCPNYFMPDNNMFRNKIYGKKQILLCSFLNEIYAGGMLFVVMSCTSLNEFLNITTRIRSPEEAIDRGIYPLLNLLYMYVCAEVIPVNFVSKILNRMYCLRRRVPKLAIDLYVLNLAHLVWRFVSKKFCYNPCLCNRQLYFEYKFCLYHLLIGTAWDVSDWLYLAMFFYSHRQFPYALTIIDFVAAECMKDNILNSVCVKMKPPSTRKELKQLSFARRYKITCVRDIYSVECDPRTSFAGLFYRELCFSKTIYTIKLKGTLSDDLRCMFGERVSNKLKEDQRMRMFYSHAIKILSEQTEYVDVAALGIVSPNSLAHYIRFMCYHHLSNNKESQHSLYDLKATVDQHYRANHIWLNSSCILLERAIEISSSNIDTIPYAQKLTNGAFWSAFNLFKNAHDD